MRAIFLDRDGVINRKAEEGRYVARWADVQFLPGALEAIAALVRHGFTIIVVTNQRGIATGQIEPQSLQDLHERLKDAVSQIGGRIADIYCCPHDISDCCDCRKPRPGMLLRAAREHNLDISNCWMIGDAASDVAAGKLAGCKTVRIAPRTEWVAHSDGPEIQVESLEQAVDHVVQWDIHNTQLKENVDSSAGAA
jgi:D-glycero-D-manno-heptose 1,7-bisphosphate phosphatase